jgi:hypothetical protein
MRVHIPREKERMHGWPRIEARHMMKAHGEGKAKCELKSKCGVKMHGVNVQKGGELRPKT